STMLNNVLPREEQVLRDPVVCREKGGGKGPRPALWHVDLEQAVAAALFWKRTREERRRQKNAYKEHTQSSPSSSSVSHLPLFSSTAASQMQQKRHSNADASHHTINRPLLLFEQ
ncbi:hypothetical protein, partial [Variovorax sp.]|uniref:hypothetical protein n=1 Tax=Variovorax sp. TaxID=1871043 RepID=UPI0025F507A0